MRHRYYLEYFFDEAIRILDFILISVILLKDNFYRAHSSAGRAAGS